MKIPILRLLLFPAASIALLAVIATTLFAWSAEAPAAEEGRASSSAGGGNQPPVLGTVVRDGAYGYSQTLGSGFSFASWKELTEEEMEKGLAEFRSDMDVVWLYYSAEAEDPAGEEVRYIWSQVPTKTFWSRKYESALIEQDDSLVPSGQPVRAKVCVPPPGGKITLQVIAINKSGAKSEPKSVLVNAAGCASETHWAQLSGFAQLRESANQGNRKSQKAFAYAYINGDGVFRNEKKGTGLMLMYAQAGNPEAQTEWAYFNYVGKYGIKENREGALKWYRAAAQQGHSHAQWAMGSFFEQDKQEVLRWYTLSAEQNHSEAQFYLAKMLAEGDGVPRDLAAAKKWMEESAKRGHERAKTWIENWEIVTAFDESGNRFPQLASVTYAGDERPISISYSARKMTYKDGKLVTEGGKSRSDTIVWRKFTVRAEDFDAESIRYLVTQISPDAPKAEIGGQRGASQYHVSGKEVVFAACFPQISGGEFTFQVIAEDKRGARSDPKTIVLEAIRSDKCS